MNSEDVKYQMELFGETWEEVIDRYDRERKKLLTSGGKVFFSWDGTEYWQDVETVKTIAKFELSHSIDPRKMN